MSGKYPFWMYGDGWKLTRNGSMRFSYTLWLRQKLARVVDKANEVLKKAAGI